MGTIAESPGLREDYSSSRSENGEESDLLFETEPNQDTNEALVVDEAVSGPQDFLRQDYEEILRNAKAEAMEEALRIVSEKEE